MAVRRSNAPFGVAAGSPNYAQGGSGNRWRYDDELIRQSAPEIFGGSMMEVLPTFAPYPGSWGGHGIQPEDVDPYGSGERLDRNVWGGFYYGYHPYEDHGYPAYFDDASYVAMARGYNDPLYDPDQDMWHYVTPIDAQPEVHDVDPWHAASSRAFDRGVPVHDSLSLAGMGMDRGHEEIQFEGHSA
jgi:hypothetical protein